MSQVDVIHYDVEGAEVAADLVNSLGSVTGNEYLADPAALRTLLQSNGLEPPTSISTEDVAAARSLRPRLRAVFEAADDEAAAYLLNELLAEPRSDLGSCATTGASGSSSCSPKSPSPIGSPRSRLQGSPHLFPSSGASGSGCAPLRDAATCSSTCRATAPGVIATPPVRRG